MPKYEVPLHYIIWVEINAESENEAWNNAGEPESETDFSIAAKYLHRDGSPEICFTDAGQPNLLEENENA
jgi:hypothetical protein